MAPAPHWPTNADQPEQRARLPLSDYDEGSYLTLTALAKIMRDHERHQDKRQTFVRSSNKLLQRSVRRQEKEAGAGGRCGRRTAAERRQKGGQGGARD